MANGNISSWPALPASPAAMAAKVAKGELVVNVKDFGAKGDNVTDDTTAIQGAIDSVGQGGRVFLPAGRYVYSSLTNRNGAFLEGAGYYIQRDATDVFGTANWANAAYTKGTVLRSTATSGDSISHFDSVTHTGGGYSNMLILGPGSGTSTGMKMGQDTPTVKAVIAPHIENVMIANFSVGWAGHHVNEGRFYGLSIRGCTKGLSFIHDVNANSWIGLNVQRCTTGLLMESGGSCYCNTFVSPIMQNMAGDHWVVRGFDNTWLSPYHESPSNPVGPFYLFDFQTGGRNTVICPDVHVTNPLRWRVSNQCHYNTFELVDVHALRYDVVDDGTSNRWTGDFDTGAALTGTGGSRIVEDRRNAYVQYPSYRASSASLPSLQSTNFALRNGTSGPQIRWHTTTPEGNISAPVGSLCGRTDAGLWYIKQTGSGTTGWFELAAVAMGTATLDFPSIAAGASAELTITVTGAAVGHAVSIGPPSTLNAGLQVTGFVSATNTVTVRLLNSTGSAVDPASATWKAVVVIR